MAFFVTLLYSLLKELLVKQLNGLKLSVAFKWGYSLKAGCYRPKERACVATVVEQFKVWLTQS